MGKLNVSIDDRLRDELFGLVPPSQRSQVVNEALRKELLRRKRQQAAEVVRRLRRRSATLSRREIVEAVQPYRAGPCPNVGADLRAATAVRRSALSPSRGRLPHSNIGVLRDTTSKKEFPRAGSRLPRRPKKVSPQAR